MDALGSIKPVVSSPKPVKADAVIAKPTQAQSLPNIGGGQSGYDAQAADAKRQEVLVKAARNAPQPLGSQVFTMFKDTTGQMVTRFRDTNSGKVTYIPEPELLRQAAATEGNADALVNINA
ncbi:MAG: hypothetical protein ACN2B6_07870 [Rickettsiales bacterium]